MLRILTILALTLTYSAFAQPARARADAYA